MAFVLAVVVMILFVREPTEALSTEALRAAKQRWTQAGVADYRLRYRMHDAVYDVKVEDRVVTGATVDGRVPRTGDLNAYSVEGLFNTLDQELDNLNDPRGPFAGITNTVLMRVRFNEELGFLERYLRSSGGQGRGVSIELIEFVRSE